MNVTTNECAGRPTKAKVRIIPHLSVLVIALIYISSARSEDSQAAVPTDNATRIVDVTLRNFGTAVEVDIERKPFS